MADPSQPDHISISSPSAQLTHQPTGWYIDIDNLREDNDKYLEMTNFVKSAIEYTEKQSYHQTELLRSLLKNQIHQKTSWEQQVDGNINVDR